MTRTHWILIAGALTTGIAATLVATRGPVRVVVDAGAVTRRAEFRSSVTASGEIVATRYADIGSSVMGKIVRLPVSEGAHVRAGQVLALIDPVQAKNDALGAIAVVRALESEERAAAEQVGAAGHDFDGATARARDAQQQLARTTELQRQGLAPAADLDKAHAAADAATAQVASARSAVDRAHQSQAAASQRIAQAKAQQTRADDMLSKSSIVSPIDGVVTRLRVREGEMVVIGIQNQPGTTLMTISDLSAIDAEVKVAEADVLRLAVGQSGSVTLEALPGRTFVGRVVEIGASALPLSGTGAAAREFKVVVRLDSVDPGLRPGMTCDAEITTSRQSNVLTVPLQSVVLRPGPDGARSSSGVFLIKDGRAQFTPVTPGVIGGLDIEIAGASEGALIIIGPYQALREMKDGALVNVASAR